VDCSVPEPRPFSTDNFSHKFNGPGIRYEVALSIYSAEIISINGPFQPGVHNDLEIFRMGLKQKLDEHNHRALADNGYCAEDPGTCVTKNGFRIGRDREEVEKFIKMMNRILARHENINARLKVFKCLTSSYRHPYDKHAFLFTAVAVLVQINISTDSPLFDIDDEEIADLLPSFDMLNISTNST
jgi:hypothetical protein